MNGRKKIWIALLVVGLSVATASAQLGSGIVYDPTNYHNALLRYYQLQQHLAQLVKQYNLAMQMARNIQNMQARYRALFSEWRNGSALNTFGNTGAWITGINTGTIGGGYQLATTQLLPYNPDHLSGMDANELSRVRSQYASVQLQDGAKPPWPRSVRSAATLWLWKYRWGTLKTIRSRPTPISTAKSLCSTKLMRRMF